ncbi:MAG: hypothetical protein PVJ67_01450 [Candidatus Pacearchaeota archaeon]|jgi:hypothetical protein
MIQIDSQNYLASIVSKNKKEYCSALEKSGIYNACEENLKGLLELLDPFFDLLNKTFWLHEPGNLHVFPKNPWEEALFQGLFQMNLVSNDKTHISLTKEGYDLIPLYRKKKNLPTKQEERQMIIDRIIAYSEKLGW